VKLSVIPDISVRIGSEEIPLQSRSAAIVSLLARHQASINGPPTTKVIFDCSPGEVTISVQPKLGRIKVGK
jgi:hypothetical protein